MQLRCEQHQAARLAATAATSVASPPLEHAHMSSALFSALPQLLARLHPCPAAASSLDLRLFNEHYVVKVSLHTRTSRLPNPPPPTPPHPPPVPNRLHVQPPESYAEFRSSRQPVHTKQQDCNIIWSSVGTAMMWSSWICYKVPYLSFWVLGFGFGVSVSPTPCIRICDCLSR